jgi:hypothetical protein
LDRQFPELFAFFRGHFSIFCLSYPSKKERKKEYLFIYLFHLSIYLSFFLFRLLDAAAVARWQRGGERAVPNKGIIESVKIIC